MELLNAFITSEALRTLLIYSLVILIGILLSRIKIYGVSFGIAFALFIGIFFKSIGFDVNKEHLEFLKEFGLILFVYALGYQLGPAFFNSFKKQGIIFNLFAFFTVFMSVLVVLMLKYIFNLDISIAVGILQGAITNTPGLGAAQQVIKEIGQNTELHLKNLGLGYAIVYPFGILGIILSIIIIKKLFNIDTNNEFNKIKQKEDKVQIVRKTIKVSNQELNNISIGEFKNKVNKNFVISRIEKDNQVITPNKDTIVRLNDLLAIVTDSNSIDYIANFIGEVVDKDLTKTNAQVTSRKVIVTHKDVLNIPLKNLDIINKYGVTITRVYRMGLEILPDPNLSLQFGDIIRVVGDEDGIQEIVKAFGHSQKKLYEPNIIPIFLGIILGITLGSIPFNIPGLPAAFKLGAAGGTIIVALLLSKYSPYLGIKNYMTPGVNLMLRDLGILFFLSSVGLNVGADYFVILFSKVGIQYISYSLIITMLPLLILGIVAYKFYNVNYLSLIGMMAGVTTDPPALAYAQSLHGSDHAALTYATVYPFVTFLRILFAQLLILLFF
ncbi:MAG TPA: putative transporter [Ignavibacteriales bacterium]|nr:putative transporter [Ignavibacteriales bacterium]